MKLTDEEKTRRLAEGVMGWTWDTSTRLWMVEEGGEMCNAEDEYWQPLTNESHAAEVRERMIDFGYEVSMAYSTLTTWVSMRKHPIDNTRHGKRSQMCRLTVECALLALGMATEEEL